MLKARTLAAKIPGFALYQKCCIGSCREIFEKENIMGKTNSKWILPSIGAVLAVCIVCVCCSGVGLYFYGDRIAAGFNNPTPTTNNPPVQNPTTEAPVETSGLPAWTVIV